MAARKYQPGRCELTRADGSHVVIRTRKATETAFLANTFDLLGFTSFEVDYREEYAAL